MFREPTYQIELTAAELKAVIETIHRAPAVIPHEREIVDKLVRATPQKPDRP